MNTSSILMTKMSDRNSNKNGNGGQEQEQERKEQERIFKEQLDIEMAETSNLASLEQRKSHSLGSSTGGKLRGRAAGVSFKDAARRVIAKMDDSEPRPPISERQLHLVQLFQQQRQLKSVKAASDSNIAAAHEIIKSASSPINTASALFTTEDAKEFKLTTKEQVGDNNTARTLIGTDTDDSDSDDDDDEDDNERKPLRTKYGSLVVEQVKKSQRKSKRRNKRIHHHVNWLRIAFCGTKGLCYCLYETVICSYLVTIGIPMFIAAWILYYFFHNPVLPLLDPTSGEKIAVSWFCNFLGQQIITLEIARIIEWMIVDFFFLGTKCAANIFGPYVTLIALQANGFPFVLFAWSLLDIIFLRGSSYYFNDWFYGTKWEIYSESNSGSFILYSPLYLRFLLSMMVVGIATAAKRTWVALHLGKRLLALFKPTMEKLLADIVLMNEIALLAEQVETIVADSSGIGSSLQRANSDNSKSSDVMISFIQKRDAITTAAQISAAGDESQAQQGLNIMEEDIAWGAGEEESPNQTSRKRASDADPNLSDRELEQLTSSSGIFSVRNFLELWDDPVEAAKNKTRSATIQDVLKFKRALGYMDESTPFGDAFGPASDRDEAIESAHKVYRKLAKFDESNNNGKSTVVNFDVLALIANDENGKPIHAKLRALKKLFRPDAHNELPLLAFIQSCDSVYKRLRYFRASVSNSSAIDRVLENMVNIIYWSIMGFLLLEMMDLDPWTLLVSITSLLVSVSFAMGSSASNYLEGLLLIVQRRPYDLGDRIMIVGPEAQDKPVPVESFYVEDINLLTTTIRCAKNNEVSTMNNFSISKSRIINLQRSPNATVDLDMKFKLSVLENNYYLKYKEALEQYVADHPRTWNALIFMRHDEIDPDWEHVIFRFSFRHRSSWQNAARIMIHRADLVRYMWEKGAELQMHYETSSARREIIDGGYIDQNGNVQRRKPGIDLPMFTNNLQLQPAV